MKMKSLNLHLKIIFFTAELFIRGLLHYIYAKYLLRNILEQSSSNLNIKILVCTIIVPELFAYPYATLAGKNLTGQHLRLLTLVCAVMPVNDSLIDNTEIALNRLEKLFIEYDSISPKNYNELLQTQLLNMIYQSDLIHENLFIPTLQNVHNAQIESRRQIIDTPNLEDLQEITANKGGYTAILFAYCVKNTLSTEEINFLYAVGYWFQLLDDLVDCKKDSKEEITTLANSLSNTEFQLLLDKQNRKIIHQIKKLPYSLWKKSTFLFKLFYLEKLSFAFFEEYNRNPQKSKSALVETIKILASIRHAYKEILTFQDPLQSS